MTASTAASTGGGRRRALSWLTTGAATWQAHAAAAAAAMAAAAVAGAMLSVSGSNQRALGERLQGRQPPPPSRRLAHLPVRHLRAYAPLRRSGHEPNAQHDLIAAVRPHAAPMQRQSNPCSVSHAGRTTTLIKTLTSFMIFASCSSSLRWCSMYLVECRGCAHAAKRGCLAAA